MDPLSHVVFGRALVAAIERPDRGRFGAGAGAAAILGALSPDIDSVLMPFGWDIYLRFHEIGTHSLLGALVLGAAAAGVVRIFAPRARYAALAAAGIVGAVSHLLLDIVSGARLHPAWPLVDTKVTLPLVAMADLWLILILAAGSIGLWIKRRQIRQPAVAVLAAVALFLSIKGVFYARALSLAAHDARTSQQSARAIEARWGSWTEWFVFDRDTTTLRIWRINGWLGTIDMQLSWPMTRESMAIAASRSLGTVRNFLSVHDLTFAVEQPAAGESAGEEADRIVLWSDVRYCRQSVPGESAISCGLWFGGTLSAGGQPLRQLVKLGEWTQTRKVSP